MSARPLRTAPESAPLAGVVLLAALTGSAHAQEPAPPEDAGVNAAPAAPSPPATGAVVPPVLLAQVAPAYPEEALHAHLVGDVVVIVTVARDGTIADVTHDSGGPAVFVPPAVAAAQQLRFTPATQDGAAVAVRVPVHFHFAPPPDELPPEAEDTLVVQAVRSPTEGEAHAVVVVDAEHLARAAGDDLAESIAEVPGVALGRNASDGTKPIIRGQQERRLLVMFDGVRHESQKWGLDHATEIDPFAAGAVHVVKGAAGVRYGPDAIGGVVLVEPHPLREDPGVGGRVQAFAQDNGRRGGLAARVDGASERVPGLAWRLEGDAAKGAALSAPDYVLGNTASTTWNAGATLARRWDHIEASLAWNHYDLRAGVTWAARSASPDDFAAQLARDVPQGADAWTSTYDVGRPYQDVSHDVGRARVRVDMAERGELEATYAFQLNRRLEYDHARASVTGPQFDFTLRTHTLQAAWTQAERELAGATLRGGIGAVGSFQENVYRGLPLVPNFRGLQGGVHAHERLTRGALSVELGARYDALARTAFLTGSAWRRSLGRGALTEGDCTLADDVAQCPATYDAASASVGLVWATDALEARLDASSATRFPNVDELYMNGTAPTSPVYALGDAGLGPETTVGTSPTIGWRLPWFHGEVSGFANRIADYVYFAPEIGEDGAPVLDVTVQGAFPRFAFRAVDAWFYGVDGGFTVLPAAPVHLDVQGALVRGVDAATGRHLVLVPPDRVRAALESAPRAFGRLDEAWAQLGAEHVFRQSRVAPEDDLAPAPEAYTLVELALGVRVPLRDRTLEVGLVGRNLLNTRYRDYTSLLRYYADEPGRAVRVRVAMDF
jgi:iron complex outermembrane receptor protein